MYCTKNELVRAVTHLLALYLACCRGWSTARDDRGRQNWGYYRAIAKAGVNVQKITPDEALSERPKYGGMASDAAERLSGGGTHGTCAVIGTIPSLMLQELGEARTRITCEASPFLFAMQCDAAVRRHKPAQPRLLGAIHQRSSLGPAQMRGWITSTGQRIWQTVVATWQAGLPVRWL